MSDRIAPEVVRRIDESAVSRLTTAIRVIEARDEELARQLGVERDELRAHRDQVIAFADRMRFGSSVPWHPEGVMDWLIAQGWTPPAGLILSDETKEVEHD